jgi:CheY-like chemotaxis protein/HPt (histidine-containing phosphotransfer) domain-containing protein
MDGEQVILAIKSDPSIADTQVVILTSMGQRGDSARLQEMGCTGVLLKPVKQSQLFQMLSSVVGKMTMIIERIPLRTTLAAPDDHNLSGLEILLAEDNLINQKLATTILSKAGANVQVVENGFQAVDLALQKSYSLILMDVQMPEMDGLEATRQIRTLEGLQKHTPILAMTAHAMQGDREMCLQAGMDGYLTKPLDQAALFAAIQHWARREEPVSLEAALKKIEVDVGIPAGWEALDNLSLEDLDQSILDGLDSCVTDQYLVSNQVELPHNGRSQSHTEAKDNQVINTPTPGRMPPDLLANEHVHLADALPRFDNQIDFFTEMFQEFYQQLDDRLIQMKQAVVQEDAPNLNRLAHNLKGVSSNFCTLPLTEYARNLEMCGQQNDLSNASEWIDRIEAEFIHLQKFQTQLLACQVTPGGRS